MLAAATPSASASPGKEVNLTLAPPTVTAGSADATVTATIANPPEARQQLGSANLTPPEGFVLTSAKIGSVAQPVDGGVLKLRNLEMAPGGPAVQVDMKLRAPCFAPDSTDWDVVLKQANDFNGSGNDIGLSAKSSDTTGVSGACTLRWVTAPRSAQRGEDITGTLYTPSAAGSSVAVFDGRREGAEKIGTATGKVELSLGNEALDLGLTYDPAQLRPAAGGVAVFNSLRVAPVGTYQLTARVADGPFFGLSATSSTFRIDEVVEDCDPGQPCAPGKLTETGYTFDLTASAASERGFLKMSPGAGISLTTSDCGGWGGYMDSTVLFDVIKSDGSSSAREKRVAILIEKDQINRFTDRGVPQLEMCFAAPKSFASAKKLTRQFDWNADGRLEDVYAGLLGSCAQAAAADPCIAQRKKVGAGDGYIEAVMPKAFGDPAMRG
jgi:hypothetical protein